MLGTRPHLREFPSRSALKLAILQHGEIHPANGYVGKVNEDNLNSVPFFDENLLSASIDNA